MKEVINEKYLITQERYKNHLKREIDYTQNITKIFLKNKIELKNVKLLLNADQVAWIENLQTKDITGYYDLYTDKNTAKKNLVIKLEIPLENHKHKGILAIKKVPNSSLLTASDPMIQVKIFAQENFNRSNIIYRTKRFIPKIKLFFNKNDFKRKQSEIDKKNAKFFTLNDKNGKIVATVMFFSPALNKNDILSFPNRRRQRDLERLSINSGFITLMGLILSLAVGYYLKNNYIKPIENLSNASNEVSSGNIEIRVDTDIKQPQIKKLLENFNNMLDQLNDKEKLQESFIANLTHDLRTPLIAEERTLELLLKDLGEKLDKDQKELLKVLLKNNKHLLSMVNQLLHTYQFKSGELELNLTEIDFSSLIDDTFKKLYPLSNEKQVTLEKHIQADLPTIQGDYDCLSRSFINLIANSIEYLPKSGKIKITVNATNSIIEIQIKDNGPGIDQEEVEHIFNQYYSGKTAKRKIGSGLGLYICKEIIEAHNGTISIETVPDEYTNFIIQLPFKEC